MAAELQSFDQLYIIGRNEVQAIDPTLTDWTEGSINDAYVGSSALIVQQAFTFVVDQFRKTFLSSAEGDELDFLAVDHYGPDFARPGDQPAIGTANFSRPTSGAGNCTILAGTIIKTEADANGNTKKYQTLSDVVMVGLTIDASIEAIDAGAVGNAEADTVTVIETSLTDATIVVNNDEAITGGEDELNDADYLEWIYERLRTLPGATLLAIESAAKTVPGITYAKAKEFIKTVIEWNEATSTSIGDPFKIVDAVLYVGDANGTASAALIALVETALEDVKAAGVKVQVISGVAIELDWTAAITLNPSGPNFATLSIDPQAIIDDMIIYLQGLSIGDDFVVATAEAAILAVWGTLGTNDLVAFETTIPVGNVAAAINEKLVPGDVEIA